MVDRYKIQTFGCFDVKKNDCSLVEKATGSKKIWELLKFMLTFKEKSFTPEFIMDHLWLDENYSDPRSTLRKQMHRLRQALECETLDTSMVLYTNGLYRWNEAQDIEVDAIMFEVKIQEGDRIKDTHPMMALRLYLEAIELYKGDYLMECYHQHWTFPIRNHYRRLYLNTVQNAILIMKACGNQSDIIALCTKAIEIDIYEEVFHIKLMEAFIDINDYRSAFNHYQYITDFLKNEMGVGPSIAMRDLYKRLLTIQATVLDDSIYDLLNDKSVMENAFYCEPTVFKSIYELEKRRIERSGGNFSVGILNIKADIKDTLSQQDLRIKHLIGQLMVKLRKGDTVTHWSNNQLVVLLTDVNDETMNEILGRILYSDLALNNVTIEKIAHLEAAEVNQLSV